MSWRDNPDAKLLLSVCRQIDEAFGGGLKLEHVAIDGKTVAGYEIVPGNNEISLSAEQIERLSAWDTQMNKPKKGRK